MNRGANASSLEDRIHNSRPDPLSEEAGAGHGTAGVESGGEVDLRLVGGEDGVAEGAGGIGLHEGHGAAAEAGAGHAGAVAGLVGHGQFDHHVLWF